jgi:hypothetical protein
MKWCVWVPLLLVSAVVCPAQLTREQKTSDFLQLAGVYAKNFAPYEWKRETLKFDLYDLRPWLDRISRSKDDLEFYEICAEYVSRLESAHDVFGLFSTFTAELPFSADIYDERILIDSIERSELPAGDYPFKAGDELVSIDGRPAAEIVRDFGKYSLASNRRSAGRTAAALLTFRPQWLMPHAHELGEQAQIVVRREGGELETYSIPWIKSGEPITAVGPVPSPRASGHTAAAGPRLFAAPFAGVEAERVDEGIARPYMRPLARLWRQRRPGPPRAVIGEGSLRPVFAAGLPGTWRQRLGRSSDAFFSGAYESGGKRIGFLRIPDFDPASTSFALRQFESEISYFQANTDGLIVDVMRNPGGNACYAEALVSYLMTEPFQVLGYELRATALWVYDFAAVLALAKEMEAEQWEIDLLAAALEDVQRAYRENRGRTGPLPICGASLETEPAADFRGRLLAYTKPLIVLADEFSSSAADAFAAMIQDNWRAPVFGMRTMGAGGNVYEFNATTYSEGFSSVTISLMHRRNPVSVSGYPATSYVENVGVRPDIEQDYMTRENLRENGRPFVEAFTAAILEQIRKGR